MSAPSATLEIEVYDLAELRKGFRWVVRREGYVLATGREDTERRALEEAHLWATGDVGAT